jgi:hypothetical protein
MKFQTKLSFLLTWGLLIGCASSENKYRPTDCIPEEQQKEIVRQMVRFANRLAPEATHETKFQPQFNWYYDRAISESRIILCAKEKDTIQLMIARKARSINPMEEGIALKVVLNANDSLLYYEEVFRMWKMPADTLVKRGRYLFDRMVKKQDLSLYYSKFQKDRFIEFPDQRFTFDPQKRRWSDHELDSILF